MYIQVFRVGIVGLDHQMITGLSTTAAQQSFRLLVKCGGHFSHLLECDNQWDLNYSLSASHKWTETAANLICTLQKFQKNCLRLILFFLFSWEKWSWKRNQWRNRLFSCTQAKCRPDACTCEYAHSWGGNWLPVSATFHSGQSWPGVPGSRPATHSRSG